MFPSMSLSYEHIKISIQEKWVLEPNYTIQHVGRKGNNFRERKMAQKNKVQI